MLHDVGTRSIPDEGTNLLMGDLLFQLAYRSCDTVERGAFMYEQALDHYYNHILALKIRVTENPDLLEEVSFMTTYSSYYNRVRFLLVALDHWEEYAVSIPGDHTIWDDLCQCAMPYYNSQALQMTIGLLKMKLIASLRLNVERYHHPIVRRILQQQLLAAGAKPSTAAKVTLVIQGFVLGPDTLLAQQVEQLQAQFSSQLDLWSAVLDRSGQLSERTAPCLFDIHMKPSRELYCFIQDCFFFDAGVSAVLNDFPDVEEAEEFED